MPHTVGWFESSLCRTSQRYQEDPCLVGGVGQHPWTFLLSCGSETITPLKSHTLGIRNRLPKWHPNALEAICMTSTWLRRTVPSTLRRANHTHRDLFPNASPGLTGIVWEQRAPKTVFNGPGFGPGLVSHQKKEMHGMLPIWESQNWCQMSSRRAGKRKDHGETDNIFGGKWTWSPVFTYIFWGVPCNGCNNHS